MVRALSESPSTFATLLRRSKFASYDPLIAQVYTTYDGHAHRGNWGLKRPLTLTKRKGSHRTIKSIDSRAQQTEWYTADQPTRWLRSAVEFGKQPEVVEGHWFENMGRQVISTSDSEYSAASSSSPSPFGPYVCRGQHGWQSSDKNRLAFSQGPNQAAMSPQQFEKYIGWLRSLRPEFRKFDRREHQRQPKSRTKKKNESLLPPPFVTATAFLHERANASFTNIHSLDLRPSPHHNAAFTYASSTEITNKFLYHPVPGRKLPTTRESSRPNYATFFVSGMIGSGSHDLERQGPHSLTDSKSHEKPFKLNAVSLQLVKPPTVIDPQGATGFRSAKMSLKIADASIISKLMSNNKPPGSPAYIAHDDSITGPGAKTKTVNLQAPSEKRLKKVHWYGAPSVSRKRSDALANIEASLDTSRRRRPDQ